MERKTDVIVLNSHGVGQYAYADRMPRWGETMRVTRWHIDQDGGKGTNISVALGRLGLNVSYVGKVGNDPWGDLGEKWMQDAGVDTTFLYRTDEVATGTALILLGPNGENAIIDGDSSSAKLTEEEVRSAIAARSEARMFVTGFEIPEQLSLLGARYAKELDMTTFLNPSPLPERPMDRLDFVDYLVLNEVEARALLELQGAESMEPADMCRSLKQRYGCPHVILTLGARGSVVLDGDDDLWKVPAPKPEKIINTAGAGDGYLAAFVTGLVRGMEVEKAAEFAGRYAAFKVTRKGSMTKRPGMGYPFAPEVEEFILGLS